MSEAEGRKVDAEIVKLLAESMKIHAEAMKIQTENRWYPFIAGAGAATALLTIGVTIERFS